MSDVDKDFGELTLGPAEKVRRLEYSPGSDSTSSER
jgi:hypothetical protein